MTTNIPLALRGGLKGLKFRKCTTLNRRSNRICSVLLQTMEKAPPSNFWTIVLGTIEYQKLTGVTMLTPSKTMTQRGSQAC